MSNRVITIMVFLLTALGAGAQKLTVESFGVAQGDLSASVNPRPDRNGVACGLVKVQLAATGAEFNGSVVGDITYRLSEYWVYMNDGAYLLEVRCPGFLPLDINLHDHGLKDGVQPKTTYKLVLLKPQESNVVTTSVAGSSPESMETFTVGGVSFNMVRVEGGTFMMGSEDSDAMGDEKPVHQVTLSGYYIGETEVTQALWKAVMGKNPSKFKGKNLPVEQVSWNDCQEFIRKLNAKTGRIFRLPTEAEWEFAARGGVKSRGYKYAGSNGSNILDVAWCWENSGDELLSGDYNVDMMEKNHCRTHPVKTKIANELGLYDMSGNVSEWCQDIYDSYSSTIETNPTGPSFGSYHVFRGGNWFLEAWNSRLTNRHHTTFLSRSDILGLRLALDDANVDYSPSDVLGGQYRMISNHQKELLKIDYGLEVCHTGKGELKNAGVPKGFTIQYVNKMPMRTIEDLRKVVKDAKASSEAVIYIEGVYPIRKKGYFTVPIERQ